MASLMHLSQRWRRRVHDERGLTLIELVVAMVLVSGVFAIAAAIFAIALRGDSQVHTTTQATAQAQGVAQGIERAVRNAQRIDVSGSTLTVWTTLEGNGACQQWSMADGTIKVAKGSTTLGTPATFGTGTAGASVSFPSTVTHGGRIIGVSYVVIYPSDTKPVEVSGTVRSRTPYDDTSPTTCGLPA